PSAFAPDPATVPKDLPNGLLLAYAQFAVEGGKVLPKPGPARLEILTRKGGEWQVEVLEDKQSNVFHKAMTYQPKGGRAGILTFAGMSAAVKLWTRGASGWQADTLWSEKFGGKWDRMRDGEVADMYGDGKATIVVATHDQGVVAALTPKGAGDAQGKAQGKAPGEAAFDVRKLGARPDTFVHEIELGDLDKDGVLEAYATPSEPNKLEGGAQSGLVWRFVPKAGKGPGVAADLGKRHAKEIYVGDVDGDGRDELYVAVEALTAGKGDSLRIVEPVEIRRYEHDTPADKGTVVATLPDRLCRFLTVGDVDGDGKREMIAAAYRSGVWLLTPGPNPNQAWKVTNIDRRSSGFEHAAVLSDLDGDGTDELYVAADEQGELRRYVWQAGKPVRTTIHKRDIPGSMMTWNLMPVPTEILQAK
ncbi:MAG: VCBS repeat-containing protein, partial [Myxococcales bacterium]|nr:VCBS repeat-containing protein [Myxococcales bacterium]